GATSCGPQNYRSPLLALGYLKLGVWEQPNTKPGEDTRWALKSRITYLSDTSQLPTTLAPGQLWTRTMRTGLELKINSLEVNSERAPALPQVPCAIAPKHRKSRMRMK